MITTWTTLLLTGLRGNAKTLHAVQMMDDFIKAGTPVFACNFEQLVLPGVQFLEDPNNWRDLPPGSVLFIDEAQKFWRSRRSGDPPQAVQDMETQRHDGVRMVILTQQPTYLDKHLRGLVDVHRHMVRRAGLEASQVYEWERCRDEWDSPANLEAAEKWIFLFPKQYYGMYKSADVHTVKRKLPARLKLIAIAVPLVIATMWYAVSSLKADAAERKETDEVAAVSAAGDTPARLSGSRGRKAPLTKEEYLAQLRPRIAGAPWSAPVYDEFNEVEEEPRVFCMIGERCRCITQQGTEYTFDARRPNRHEAMCRAQVEQGGMYNPFKRKAEASDRGVGAEAPTAMDASASASSPGPIIEGDQVTGYGDIKVGDG